MTVAQSTEKYNVIMVPPEKLIGLNWQPASRIDSSMSLNALKRSIADKDVGLQYPPLVIPREDGNFDVVDGNRRIACMKELGWQLIPVLPTRGKTETLFAEVSGNVAKMRATEWIEVHLGGGTVPSGPMRSCINQLEKVMGREFLIALRKERMSPSIWHLANRAIKYMRLSDDDRPDILNWLFNVGTKEVNAWITGSNQISGLTTAFKENRTPRMG